MKGTEHFKRTIQMYLEQRAAEDTLFAKNYRNPAKNIDECVTYILKDVYKRQVDRSVGKGRIFWETSLNLEQVLEKIQLRPDFEVARYWKIRQRIIRRRKIQCN